MITEITYKSPDSKEKDIVVVKPFKLEHVEEIAEAYDRHMPFLEAVPRCYVCGNELKTEEKQHESTFKCYDTDGTIVGTVETYVCFDCIEKLTGRRPDHE